MNSNPNKSPLDVALLTPAMTGGVGLITVTLAEEMQRKGLEVEIWSLKEDGGDSILTNIPVRYLPTAQASRSLPGIIKLLNNRRPRSVLSASYHVNCMVIVARMISRIKFRLVIVEHTSLGNGFATISFLKRTLAKLAMRICYRFADAWVAVSRGAAEQMAHFAGLKESAVVTIYNPVVNDTVFEKSREPVEHPFFALDEPLLLSVGRMSPEKDYPNLLTAFAIVNQTTPARLIMAGDGPEMDTVKQVVRDLDIADRVSLLGHVNPYPLYTKARVFVMSSTREGLPTVLIEALALGCQVVSTDARTGPREILKDGAYGSLVPTEDSEALAQAIIEAITNPPKTLPEDALAPYKNEVATDYYLDILFPEEISA